MERTYFFDVHPPFGKLLLALIGWFVGYDGHFKFENIGDSYVANGVPYVALRAMPAMLGALTVPVVFLTMQESGYRLPATVTAATIILFGMQPEFSSYDKRQLILGKIMHILDRPD